MTYELAGKLKDAGFHFEGCLPTLSELMEALIDNHYELRNRCGYAGKRYAAEGVILIKNFSEITRPETYGATPEEALAKLWLVLNKK